MSIFGLYYLGWIGILLAVFVVWMVSIPIAWLFDCDVPDVFMVAALSLAVVALVSAFLP